jgi:hypothetical protein
MECLHKYAVAVMPIIILLLHVNLCHIGHHLSLVMNGVKVTEEAHVWVLAVCHMVEQVYIYDIAWDVFTNRHLLHCS